MKKFVCTVCGYVHEGDAAPAECPATTDTALKPSQRRSTAGHSSLPTMAISRNA